MNPSIESEKTNNADNDSERAFNLLSQLHEQYAINNNSNLSSILGFIATLLAILYAYGHVFIHSTPNSANQIANNILITEKGLYTPMALTYTACAAVIGLSIICHFCIYIGVNQRREQFITYAIRRRYGLQPNLPDNPLPKDYHPYDKSGLNIIQGLFGELVKIDLVIILLLSVSYFIRMIQISLCNEFVKSSMIYCEILFLSVVYILSQMFVNFRKYKSRQESYTKNRN